METLLNKKGPSTFEDAVTITGFGKFNILVLLVLMPANFASVFETTTMSYIFSSAQCDLNLSLEDKGFLNSISYIGMISGGVLWGFLIDTLGRKKLLVCGFLLDGTFVLLSSLSQSLTLLVISKFLGGFMDTSSRFQNKLVVVDTVGSRSQHIGKNQMKSITEQEYRCEKCVFRTRRRKSLKLHQKFHKDPLEIKTHECSQCSYKTKRKRHLDRHQLTHTDPSEIEMYQCSQCSHKTKTKGNLKTHELRHKHPSEMQMFVCEECKFATKYKSSLLNHQLIHKNLSETQMYLCSQCSYKTKRKSSLMTHQLIHRDRSEVPTYACEDCKFETIHRTSFRNHQLTHKNPSEIRMYECGQCSYKAKLKGRLKDHQLVHKSRPQMQT